MTFLRYAPCHHNNEHIVCRGLIATFVSSSFVSSLPQIAIQKERINQNVYSLLILYMQAYYYHSVVSRRNAVIAIFKKRSLHYQKLSKTRGITIFPP